MASGLFSGALNTAQRIRLILMRKRRQHSVSLKWSESDSNVTFNIYRSTTGGYTKINTSPVSALTYLDSTVVAGTKYFYVVTALSNNMESLHSNQVTAVIPSP